MDLLSNQINDRELENLLASLYSLHFLSLAETRVGNANLECLKNLKYVQEVILWNTKATHESATAL